VSEGVRAVELVVVLGLVWSELRRRRRSHRPATVVPWPPGGEEKERRENARAWAELGRGERGRPRKEEERAWVGRVSVLGRAKRGECSRPVMTIFVFFF
jgi:hypothetical protein